MANKKATIQDISELTGLSTATISRAINQKGYVSMKSLKLISEAQKKLNYYPKKQNITVDSLSGRQVMLILPNNNNPFWFPYIKAVQSICRKNNFFLTLTFTNETDEELLASIQSAKNLDLSGVIMVSLNMTKELFDSFEKLDTAKVLCGFNTKPRPFAGYQFDFISVDTRQGIYLATSHLIKKGYRDIAYIGLDLSTTTGEERLKGFENAMKDAGLPINPYWTILGKDSLSEQRGYEAVYKFHKAKKMPDAVCTSNDITALGVYRACHELNIAIPDKMGLIGMDDIEIIYYLSPSISSIDISPYDLGRNSANLLINRMKVNDGLYQNIILDPKLTAKDSTGDYSNTKLNIYDESQ